MRGPCVDVTGYGLLLWSLRRPNNQYLSCQLGEGDSDFVLLIRDHEHDTVPFADIGSDMASLLSLAKLLRIAYVAAGWQRCAKVTAQHAAPLAGTASEGAAMLKVELHTHTADDPEDYISHTPHQLIDRAVDLDYDALAITLHNKQLDVEPFRAYAGERGLVLIPGVERALQGKHVLLINFSSRAEHVDTFENLALLKREEPVGLVVAPHPFFPMGSCLRTVLNRHADLIDAVEFNAMYSPMVNFNLAGERWAARHRKPMVGNGDVHLLEQLGTTYSLVDAAPSPDAICEAIRVGSVSVEAVPLSLFQAAWLFARILPSGVMGAARNRFARLRTAHA